MRAPPRVASNLACVWLSEKAVAAKMTVASRIASATSANGSSPCRVSVGYTSTLTLRADPSAAAAIEPATTRCSSLQSTSTSSAAVTPRQRSAASAARRSVLVTLVGPPGLALPQLDGSESRCTG